MKYKTLKTTDIQHDYELLMGKINVLQALVLEYVTSCHHVQVIITNN